MTYSTQQNTWKVIWVCSKTELPDNSFEYGVTQSTFYAEQVIRQIDYKNWLGQYSPASTFCLLLWLRQIFKIVKCSFEKVETIGRFSSAAKSTKLSGFPWFPLETQPTQLFSFILHTKLSLKCVLTIAEIHMHFQLQASVFLQTQNERKIIFIRCENKYYTSKNLSSNSARLLKC